MSEDLSTIEQTVLSEYKYGFVTNIEADEAPKGLNEDTIRFISAKKNEPSWMLEWRLKAFQTWLRMEKEEPRWAHLSIPAI
ncbi:MAG: Fe-S cluster assembly protein SufB, partial [Bacteroidota bacterium]|nr:Fe-S cluster assembly protein SufB [Bacteroidota bacterium]